MKQYTTTIKAIIKGEVKTFCGPNVQGISFADAQDYCENNGLGYCTVTGVLVATIPVKENKPDFDNAINYENINLN